MYLLENRDESIFWVEVLLLTIGFLPLIISGADIKTVPVDPKTHVKEDISTLTRSEAVNNKEGQHVDKTRSINTAKSSSDFEEVTIQKKGDLLIYLSQE